MASMQKFQPGDQIEVLNTATGKWIAGTVERRWAMAMLPEGTRCFEYDIIGVFPEDGEAWHGTFDQSHVRSKPAPRVPPKNWLCRKHSKPCPGDGPACVQW